MVLNQRVGPQGTEWNICPELGGTKAELVQIAQTDKIPNAFLFTGPLGSGKKQTGFEFAKLCNCRGKGSSPCGFCTPCKKITAGLHPDIISIGLAANKKAISIAQVRELGHQLSVRPNEAAHRMVFIQDADLMNIQAQNGLLKVLEEPPDNTFFILSATRTAPLLPTIVSRCRQIRFTPLSRARIKKKLMDQLGLDSQKAHIAAQTAGEDLLIRLYDPEHHGQEKDIIGSWFTWRTWLAGEILSLLPCKQKKTDPAECLALSLRLSREPERIPDALAIITTILRDFCVFEYAPEKIVNLDFSDAFEDISQVVKAQVFHNWVNDLYETEKRLGANTGARLTLDRFFLGLSSAIG